MAPPANTAPASVAAGFHALSDATRIEILELLRSGEHCVCELTDALGTAQSRLSFHLKVLKDAGLVTDRRDGRWVYYTLHAGALGALEAFLEYLGTACPPPARRPACCP